MVSAGYYRSEAARCRRLAEESEDSEAAARWRALARDYNALADALEKDDAPPTTMHVPMQQQPLQQQQAKTEPDEDS